MSVVSLGKAARGVAPVAWTALSVLVLCMGCAAGGPKGEIPVGQWTGQGTFVYEYWKPADADAKVAKPQSIHRHYPTSLTIGPGRLAGREVIELQILSERGPLPKLGDKTHLKVALLKAKRVSDTTTLYRVVGLLFNPKPNETLRFNDSAPPFGASCTTVNGTTVLQIQYADNFVDTLRFRGYRVEKSGCAFNLNEAMAHWSEDLVRKDLSSIKRCLCPSARARRAVPK